MTTTNDLITEGISRRQIEHWIAAGYLNVDSPGSGTARDWPPEEVRVARLMRELTRAGLSVRASAEIARTAAEQTTGSRCRVERRPGVWIEVAS